MADSESSAAPAVSAPAAPPAPASPAKKVAKPKAAKKPASAKPRVAAIHPLVADMVIAAIKALKDRKGSSLPAIKKYVSANYKVDISKLAPHVKKFLKTSAATGKLVQTKGTGASGSFKLGTAAKVEKPKKPAALKNAAAKKPAAKKRVANQSARMSVPSKPKKPAAKKPAAKKSPVKTKKPAAAAKSKAKVADKPSPKAVKKIANPKVSKPKVANKPTAKKSTPKKAAKA